jgi:hypothetical protein
MQTQQTITLFGTVSNSASSRITKNGRRYTAFGVAIISDRNLPAFSYNVVVWGKRGPLRQIPPEGNPHQASYPGAVSARQHPNPHRNLRATGSSGRGCTLRRVVTSPSPVYVNIIQ